VESKACARNRGQLIFLGLMTATALIAAVGDISVFKNGRGLADPNYWNNCPF